MTLSVVVAWDVPKVVWLTCDFSFGRGTSKGNRYFKGKLAPFTMSKKRCNVKRRRERENVDCQSP